MTKQTQTIICTHNPLAYKTLSNFTLAKDLNIEFEMLLVDYKKGGKNKNKTLE